MPGRRTRESALDTSPPANTSAAVSPMGERGGAAEPQPGTGRARCVPDQPVIWGISRSLADSPAPALSCGYAAHGGPANVLLSSRTRVRVAVGAQVRRGVAPRRVSLGAKLGAKVLRSRHVRDECSAPWARCGRDLLGRREEPVHGFGLARVRPRREADPAESLLKPTPRRRSVPTIWIRSARDREVSGWARSHRGL